MDSIKMDYQITRLAVVDHRVAPLASLSGRDTLANLLENGFDTVEHLRSIEASTRATRPSTAWQDIEKARKKAAWRRHHDRRHLGC